MSLGRFASTATDLLPDEEAVSFYERHGWWVSPRIVDDQLIDAALEATERYYRGELDDGPPIPAAAVPAPPYNGGIRAHLHGALRCEEFRAVALHPLVGATAARLARVSTIRLFHDQFVCKPPEQAGETHTRIGWHTDGQYWRSCTSKRMLTAWIPLHDVDETIGTLMFLDGSNHWSNEVAGKAHSDGYEQDLDQQERALTIERHAEKVAPHLRKGQVSFHSMWTYHASGPNRTARPRLTLSVHLQDGDNRHTRTPVVDGAPPRHAIDDLVRIRDGVPDYTDERYCPSLWPRPT